MIGKHARTALWLLFVSVLLVPPHTACNVPLPPPREQAALTTTSPITDEATPETVPHTPPPAGAATNTPIFVVLPTDTPTSTVDLSLEAVTPEIVPTATATRVLSHASPTATEVLTTLVTDRITKTPGPSISLVPSRTPTAPPVRARGEQQTAAADETAETATPTAEPTPSITRALALEADAAVPDASRTEVVSFVPASGNALLNGDFEGGFDALGIGHGWKGFHNVEGTYGWSDETWPGLVWEGNHAQMMRIRTASQSDRYIGIYQTVPVARGQPYELEMHGLIRSSEGSPQDSGWGYRLQWGLDLDGGQNWQDVETWYDAGWDDQPLDAAYPEIQGHKAAITPPNDSVTLFIRGWRKWGTANRGVEFVVDGLQLTGPSPTLGAPNNLPHTGDSPWTFSIFAAIVLACALALTRRARFRRSAGRGS